MKMIAVSLAILAATLSTMSWPGDRSGRPEHFSLAEFQFGPVNRWSFSHMREVLPTANIARDPNRFLPLARSSDYVADISLTLEGQSEQTIDQIARDQYLDGVLVLRHNEIVFEKYWGDLSEERPHLMNSVSKSVVGLLAGTLAGEGVIDLAKPVSHYVPELAKSGWGPDSLRTVLDMRDGSDYTEDYEDFSTTFRLQDCAVGWTDAAYCPENGPRGGYAFFPTIGRNEDNVGSLHYRSGSADVMGWVLEAATGRGLAELISKHIWKPMGAEFDANITVDASAFALADHGMSSTLRDLGRLGLLVLNRGKALGRQVVPASFIDDIISQPGNPEWPYGKAEGTEQFYRSFWWGSIGTDRAVTGYGIHGQTVRVVPEADMVVVIYSSWPRAGGETDRDLWWPLDYLLEALEAKFREPQRPPTGLD